MIWQDIILITIGIIYMVGIIYQIHLFNKQEKHSFSFKGLMLDILLFLVMVVIGVVVIPTNWMINMLNSQSNPIPKMKTYTLSKEINAYKESLLSLGFEYFDNRVSKDNIVYSGFVFREPPKKTFSRPDVWVILALDKQKDDNKDVVRMSIYKENKIVKKILPQVDKLLKE